MNDMKRHIEALAEQSGKSQIEVISELQAGAAKLDDDEETLEQLTELKIEYISELNKCSCWVPVDVEPVPDGLVCDMVMQSRERKKERMANVVHLDDSVFDESALGYDPDGDAPELCSIEEISHWAKIVLP